MFRRATRPKMPFLGAESALSGVFSEGVTMFSPSGVCDGDVGTNLRGLAGELAPLDDTRHVLKLPRGTPPRPQGSVV